MTSTSETDLAYGPRGQFEPAFAVKQSCEYCGSAVKRLEGLGLAYNGDPPGKNAVDDPVSEDELVELAIQVLESTRIFEDLPASMRLIEHLAESAGYQRARQSETTRITELMLMAARASALADDFRKD